MLTRDSHRVSRTKQHVPPSAGSSISRSGPKDAFTRAEARTVKVAHSRNGQPVQLKPLNMHIHGNDLCVAERGTVCKKCTNAADTQGAGQTLPSGAGIGRKQSAGLNEHLLSSARGLSRLFYASAVPLLSSRRWTIEQETYQRRSPRPFSPEVSLYLRLWIAI